MDKFWLSFMDTVRAFGRVYEIGTMSLYMLRSLRMNTDLDLAMPALAHRKLPFVPHLSKEGLPRSWQDYLPLSRKAGETGEAPMKIAYYPGCSQEGSALDYGKSTGAVCAAFGFHLEEIPNWTCCVALLRLMPWTRNFPPRFAPAILTLRQGKKPMLLLRRAQVAWNNLRLASHRMENPSFRGKR